MGYKTKDGKYICRCLDSLKPGEPFFVLKATDLTADETVEFWLNRNKLLKEQGIAKIGNDKILSAESTVRAMRQWAPRKYPD